MNAPLHVSDIIRQAEPFGDLKDFHEYCAIEADMVARGWVDWHHGVDTCQWIAERWGLVDAIGQDRVQAAMAEAFGALCAAPDDLELDEEPAPPPLVPEAPNRGYRTPQSTIDAFGYLTRTADAATLAAWLKDRPRDANTLHRIWKAKQCSTAAA